MRSVRTATSVGDASRSRPYSTSTLFGRSAPFSNWRSLPSVPNTASAPSGAATFIVPRIRLFDADGIAVQIRRQRLRDFDRLKQLGRNHVDRHLTDERVGGRNPLAVDHHGIEPGFGAADVHVPALALIFGD